MSCPGAAGRDGSASRSDAGAPDRRFPRTCRLTARRQFIAVYEKGRRTGCPYFTLFGLPNSVGHCRLGVTVTRKVGGAVRRNRIKRVLRDIFRRHRLELDPALDLVVNPHAGAHDVDTATLEAEFLARFAALARRFRP